ncbi:MAG: DUF5320 domain-containing protein [Elusimicrobia bacterium]|nr:DUF5320 domain-containing protein [Elusimicrobiota bacterium]
MPGRNGTGPDGKGPKTGRGMGNCGTNETDDVRNTNRQGLGRGRGMGMGLGRGPGKGMGRGGKGRGQSSR